MVVVLVVSVAEEGSVAVNSVGVVAIGIGAVDTVVVVVGSSAAVALEASVVVVVVDDDTVVAVDTEIVVVAQVVAVGYGEEHNSC